MKKVYACLLLLVFFGIAFVSCVNENVTYCPFCGKSSIREVSNYNPLTGITSIYYECMNPDCGKKFGAGQILKEPK